MPASPTPGVVTPVGGQDLVANGLVFTNQGDLVGARGKISYEDPPLEIGG